MPFFKHFSSVELARNLRAFLRLEAGLTRGAVPGAGFLGNQDRRIGQLEKRAEVSVDSTDAALQVQDRLTVFRRLLEPLPPGKLLDLACGHGKFSMIARDLGWEVTAVDARTGRMPETQGIRWVQADVRAFEVAEGEYDCISVLGLLYHLELEDQLALLRKCAGTTTVVDTHVALKADHEESGYRGTLFDEVLGATSEQHAATPTASWENRVSFWPTEESLLRMFHDSGFSCAFRLTPPHTTNRTFYLCLAGPGDTQEAGVEERQSS